MKKKMCFLLAFFMMLVTINCEAASYTLPEKMKNQLAIGSGLKGTFSITAEGPKAKTPFLDAVTDAEFSILGISSGDDFYYSVFQTDQSETQSALSELYRKEGICYFRSDMVQGKILAFPTSVQLMDSFFPAKGENPSLASFYVNYLTLSEDERNNRWKPVLTRYQNELEMWLADFTLQPDLVKQDSGSLALDFTYVIPASELKARIIALFEEFASDGELQALLDTVMTPEQKNVYFNGNLSYFYEEALQSLDLNQEVRMNKRVTAMGVVLSSSIFLPLDPSVTGYRSLTVENAEKQTVYKLEKEDQAVILVLPASDDENLQDYRKSVWLTRLSQADGENTVPSNISVRLDIEKNSKLYDDAEEKSHQEDHYQISIQRDVKYIPEGFDPGSVFEFEQINADLTLHYYSKYSQNSATTLEISAEIRQGDSRLSISGTMKTAKPWLFMPFEIIDPITVDPKNTAELITYATDWISNAGSIIRHKSADEAVSADTGTEQVPAGDTAQADPPAQEESENPQQDEAAETVPPESPETAPLPETVEQELSGTDAGQD